MPNMDAGQGTGEPQDAKQPQQDAATGQDAGNGGEPHGEPSTDWKAEARKWEARAKQNSQAAAELERLKTENMSEAEKTARRLQKLEAENAAFKAEQQHREWASQVSKDTGVPAALLTATSLESMQDQAKALKTWADSRTPAGGRIRLGSEPKPPAPSSLAQTAAMIFGTK